MKVECLCKLNETGREKQILHGYTCGIIKKKKSCTSNRESEWLWPWARGQENGERLVK